jgi:D-tyrosyl-tRNA(Tyr) deacylase
MPTVWYNQSASTYRAILLCYLLSTLWATGAMRLVVQRVKSASVTVDGSIVSSIDRGALALIGLHEHDTKEDLEYCCKKLLGCKLWENDGGAMWRQGAKQLGLEILCVSQFTVSSARIERHGCAFRRSDWGGPKMLRI